jgi:hypothetical protein
MSEIRVDKIQAHEGTISFTGITTFSGTGAFGLPGGNTAKRPEVPKEGQVRYINGDVKKGLEYYNGTEWVTVGVANGSVPEGTTPIGVFGGGGVVNTIDYIAITSLGNATDFGDLTVGRSNLSACSSSTRGVFGNGNTGVGPLYNQNMIDYITISTTGNAQDFGDVTVPRSYVSGCSSSTRGIIAGGYAASPGLAWNNTIEYVTIATIGNAQDFGDLFTGRYSCGSCSSSTRGVFGGGLISPAVVTNTIEYITITTTANAQTFGQLFQSRGYTAACSSSTRGVFGGGDASSPTRENTIDYITIATTGNAFNFGDLTQARFTLAACSSSTRGVFGGGGTPTSVNTIDYITIASNGTDAQDFGDLTQARQQLAALSNSHGGLLTS